MSLPKMPSCASFVRIALFAVLALPFMASSEASSLTAPTARKPGSALAAPAPRAPAPDVGNPEQFQCMGRNRFSGSPIVPVEKQGDTADWAYAVFLTDPVQGTPIIVYGPAFRLMPPLLQAFVRRHECQHANGILDEVAANCLALAQMRSQGMTPEQESVLERWHLGKGRLDPQYGGSGAAFWERTLNCAASVR